MLSAIVSASVWRRSISCWPGASSWKLYSTGNAQRFECADRLLAQLARDVVGGQVEVAALIDRDGQLAGHEWFEVEELDVGGDVEGEAGVVG